MVLVPGMAGSMSQGFGSGGISGLAGWLSGFKPRHTPGVRLAIVIVVSLTVAVVAIGFRRPSAMKIAAATLGGLIVMGDTWNPVPPTFREIVFQQGSGYTSILEENMWMGPGVVFYA